MAYTLKYSSNFYNIYGKYIEVEISKADYSGAVTALRNTEVYIEVNFQGNNTPIIGTGASIVVVNQNEFTSLEDLLTTQEKQFKCVIKYDSVTVFQGFSICDLNEQQFLPYSRIKLQFTDYLRRLEGYFAPNFAIGSNTDLLTLVQELIVPVGFGAAYQLYVNSTLFESHMTNDGLTDTFLKQTYVENNMFFSDPNTYDDVYAMINRTLKSFGCFLYSCGDKWIIERQEDVVRDKNTSSWVVYTLYQVASNTPSLKEEYNKQEGDFSYVDESQVLEYASGLKTLILNLKDKQFDTLVFNDYTTAMGTVNDTTPDPGTLQYRTWYAYVDNLLLNNGFDYKGISSFIKWSYPLTLNDTGDFMMMGLYYMFQLQFPASPEEPVILDINYKMAGELNMNHVAKVTMWFVIRLDGGPYDGYYLGKTMLPDSSVMVDVLFSSYTDIVRNIVEVDVSDSAESVWTVNMSFNLTEDVSVDGSNYTSIWQLLGGTALSQKFMIYFFPSLISSPGPEGTLIKYNRVNYLGDVQVTTPNQKTLNKITYYINEDFVKTEEIDMDFYDLDNAGFANGLMYGLGGVGNDAIAKTTESWTSEKVTTPDALMDVFAANKFRNYSRTIHKLKARIMHDGYMKPLSVLTDDNRMVDSQIYTTFILQGYTWDLNNGIYDITAEEYTAEDILIGTEEDSGGASSGDTYSGDPGIVPPVPTGLAAVQTVPASSIDISWNASEGASGYILQRQPYYSILGTWVNQWKTVWEGANAFTADPIQLEGTPANGVHFSYRVLAKTSQVFSAYSSTEVLIWTA